LPSVGDSSNVSTGGTAGRETIDEKSAKAVAEALGGAAWNSGGGMWLVRLEREDGRLVVLSDEVVCEYADEDAFERTEPAASVVLH